MDALHFLRPLWLLSIPVTVFVWWLLRRRQVTPACLGEFVAPHLRDALTINNDSGEGARAVDGVALGMLAIAVAAAGPTWSKQVSPWFEETAPLVLAMEVTDSMRSNDLAPTRLERARFKVLDLIGERTGSRTALIAYAGSAHIVMPPSSDTQVLKLFLESLDPVIMPTLGTRAESVLPVARELLGADVATGTLLFVNDGFEAADLPALSAFSAEPGAPPMAALVVGTDAGGVALLPDGTPVSGTTGGALDTSIDPELLRRVEREAGVSIVRSGAGDADIRALMRTIDSNLRRADDPNAQWRDQGWWLLWPASLLSLGWFRRGWTMQW
jgi:Ca-activated chloride channel family protein